ncbi:nitrite reductase [Nocardioides convexus]|uniref:nitrite reductase n=1 Tax=Nocardioides convexus TaxID=2712224 RepID=UPI0024186DC2|nr:nitrite reductase [Nocardioides convexus]
MARSRPDRCPGIVHPWPADDGGLVRIRVPGGRVALSALRALAEVAATYGDGRVRVTGRANLQVRAMPLAGDRLADEALDALEATGLLPSRAHDRIRNVLASPQTGYAGGRADLRPVVTALDAVLLGDEALAGLPGRFLFTLDDGRGDLAERHKDLGLVALDAQTAQAPASARAGARWSRWPGPRTPSPAWPGTSWSPAAPAPRRPGTWPSLPASLAPLRDPRPGADVRSEPLPFGAVPGGEHVPVGDDGLSSADLAAWRAETVVVTPWHGVLIPEPLPEETP